MLRVDEFIPARPGAGGLAFNIYSKAWACAREEIAPLGVADQDHGARGLRHAALGLERYREHFR
jgi:hypothetical protein